MTTPIQPVSAKTSALINKPFNKDFLARVSREQPIQNHLKQQQFQQAFELLKAEDEKQPLTSTYVLNYFLHKLSSTSDFPGYLPKIYAFFEKNKIQPDVYTFIPILRGCAKQDVSALPTWETKMRQANVVPNSHILTVLIDAYGGYNRYIENFERVVQEAYNGDVGDTILFYTIIKVWAAKKNLAKIEEALKIMEERGIKCDMVAYNTVIGVCAAVGEIGKMRNYFTEMKKNNIEINLNTYAAMFHGYLQYGSLNEANTLLKEMNNLGFAASTTILNNFLQKFKNRDDTYNMKRAYELMKTQYVKPDLTTISLLALQYVKKGDSNGVKYCLQEMAENNVKPDAPLSLGLLKHFIFERNFELFQKIVKYIQDNSKEKLTPETYHVILAGYHKFDQIDMALEFFNEVNKNYAMDAKSYQLLIEIYGSAKNYGKLTELWGQYKKTCQVDSATAEAMIKGLFNCDNKDEAKHILLEGVSSDVVLAQVYRTFIRLYLKLVQEQKERPEISLVKAVKRVSTSLEGVERLEAQEIKRLNELIKAL